MCINVTQPLAIGMGRAEVPGVFALSHEFLNLHRFYTSVIWLIPSYRILNRNELINDINRVVW
jgi:hypothetical protein